MRKKNWTWRGRVVGIKRFEEQAHADSKGNRGGFERQEARGSLKFWDDSRKWGGGPIPIETAPRECRI